MTAVWSPRSSGHPGELIIPRFGFVVTNLNRPSERVTTFYNQRGKAEQWIKEGERVFNIDPPKSSNTNAIMQRAQPRPRREQ